MSDQNNIDDFSNLMNDISSKNYINKFFRNRPIADSREDAVMDVDVEKFLTQKYDIDIIKEKDDNYVLSFIHRLLERII